MDKKKYKLRYLTLPEKFYSDNRLNATELKVLAFIYSYTGDRFYFGNENMADMFNVSGRSITNAVSKLRKLGYIDTSYDISAGGGKIRFITRLAKDFTSDRKSYSRQNRQVLLHKDNKIKDNKIKEIQGHESVQKTKTQENTHKVLEIFNEVQQRSSSNRFISARSFEKNLPFWLELYSLDDIRRAVERSRRHQFWRDRLTPERLFRRKNTNGEEVDRIQELLTFRQ